MLAALPLATWVLTFAVLRRRTRGDRDRRWCLLAASVATGVVLVLGTELLGALRLLAPTPLALLWGGALSVASVTLARSRPRLSRGDPVRIRLDLLLAGTAVLLAGILLAALFAAPSSWDALTYHLPRAEHWLGNRAVSHYPTHILRQLFMPPGAEYAQAHLAALTGGDRLANLPQWLALAGSAAGVSKIAALLGGNAPAQVLAGVFAVSLPMSVAQGSSSQNDAVVAFWLVAFVAFLVPLAGPRGPLPVPDAMLGAASLGLAVATKGTAPLFAFPFALLFGALLFRRSRGAFWRQALLGGALVLAPSLPHFLRNQALFGSPLGPPAGVLVETLDPRAAASGLLRNVAVHFVLPSPAWNRAVESAVRSAHAAIAWDPEDARTTWAGSRFRVPPVPAGSAAPDADETLYLLLHEGYAASPLHPLLLLASFAVAARAGRPASRYALACAGAFLLFCAALKWQPWHARLHLPLFVLGAPAVGLALSGRPGVGRWAGAGLLLAAAPWLLAGSTRPLLGPESVLRTPRASQYFSTRPDLEEPFLTAAAALPRRPCPLGLRIGPDDGEYLVSVALEAAGHPARPLVHVGVRNPSGSLGNPEDPCASWELAPGADRPRVMAR